MCYALRLRTTYITHWKSRAEAAAEKKASSLRRSLNLVASRNRNFVSRPFRTKVTLHIYLLSAVLLQSQVARSDQIDTEGHRAFYRGQIAPESLY